jgi:hypothetical protein
MKIKANLLDDKVVLRDEENYIDKLQVNSAINTAIDNLPVKPTGNNYEFKKADDTVNLDLNDGEW